MNPPVVVVEDRSHRSAAVGATKERAFLAQLPPNLSLFLAGHPFLKHACESAGDSAVPAEGECRESEGRQTAIPTSGL